MSKAERDAWSRSALLREQEKQRQWAALVAAEKTEESPMSKKAKKKVSKKTGKKRAKKVRVKSASTSTTKKVRKAKKTRVKSSSTTTHKKRSKSGKKTGKKRSVRKYANKKGKAWQAFMAKEGKARRPMQGPVQRKKRVSKPKEKTVTAASILKGSKSYKTKAWLCAGPKRTGCGGGKKGGHVLATLF